MDLANRLRDGARQIYSMTVGDLDLLIYEAKRAGCKPFAVRSGANAMQAARDYLMAAAAEIDAAREVAA